VGCADAERPGQNSDESGDNRLQAALGPPCPPVSAQARRACLWRVRGKGVLFELLLAAFNLIFAPALALFTTDSNCFSEALYAPPPVSSSYNTTVDIVSINFLTTSYTDGTSTTEELTNHTSSSVRSELSYVPTFQYGYQCSATLLQAYGPVFLLMALFSCLGEPALLALVRLVIDKGGPRFSRLRWLLPRALLSLAHPAGKGGLPCI
jgi:hypothetical protein